jgi:hypothetical protein
MQVPPGFFPHAVGSFQNPVVPPVVPPDNPTDQICVQFSRAWLPYVLGALSQLILQSTWQGDDSTVEGAQINAMLLRYLFSLADICPFVCPIGAGGFELLIRQDPTNNCLVQSSPDGTHWQTFIDLSLCNPGNAQPGTGSPQPPPGGGTATYCATLQANGLLLLPTLVSSGDKITLQSASGAGWDGTEIDFGPLYRCPDGEQFIAGACVGFAHTSGSDPVPTVNHMELIVLINGAYYGFTGGALTVPGGISNKQALIQVNDPTLADNQGSYQVCAEVTNNQTPTWTHTFDFTVSMGGWSAVDVGGGTLAATYIPGTGWEANSGYNVGVIRVSRVSVAGTITAAELTYLYPDTSHLASTELRNAAFNPMPTSPGEPGAAFYQTRTESTPGNVDGTGFEMALIEDSALTSGIVISRLVLHGTGSDPY